ncbi:MULTISPECIES: endonuclease SmrB [unclassified Serratia (in: enterobacteria)]|uniref:endonuclease SmrB n=1 Tax=unclassified Serratia (in: enterobacteria) TaxID=2647522 RepID=UPI000469C469|nr:MULTISPECIES: endonuclease SmrB [unclassified Serratia (in: enterobacteria)]
MKNKHPLSKDELLLFRESVAGAKKLPQDTIVHPKPKMKTRQITPQRLLQEQVDASFYFSDEFQPQLDDEGPTRYVRPGYSHYELKKLRRGDYVPDLFLDLHGLTQMQAKQELGAMIAACKREHVHCACVMHGHGKHILKQQTPLWLAQHPDVLAFHQAPKEWGGSAAVLLLVELPE